MVLTSTDFDLGGTLHSTPTCPTGLHVMASVTFYRSQRMHYNSMRKSADTNCLHIGSIEMEVWCIWLAFLLLFFLFFYFPSTGRWVGYLDWMCCCRMHWVLWEHALYGHRIRRYICMLAASITTDISHCRPIRVKKSWPVKLFTCAQQKESFLINYTPTSLRWHAWETRKPSYY